ncbi:MAG: ABC transporter ATP-binding protein [Spirochaetia bacterium]
MIRLEHVNKIFHEGTPDENRAIKNLDLKVNEGDFITIVGSNGAGKTTLFNLISGNMLPSDGKILINDTDVSKQPEYKRSNFIGRIFQNPLMGTASNMTVEENMLITSKKGFKWLKLSLNNEKRKLFQQELTQLDMDLEHRLKHPVGLLSGGQRQALTLLMIVLSRPALVLLDEHTAALDPRNAKIVLDLTEKFIREYSLTAMMVTHNMKHAIEMGNRLLMMDGGEIILDISGKEKENLTVEKLVDKFYQARHRTLESDEVLLSH